VPYGPKAQRARWPRSAPIGVRRSNDPAKRHAERDQSLATNEISGCRECGSRVRRSICKAIGEVAAFGSCVPVRVEIFHCDKCDFAEFSGNWSLDAEAASVASAQARPLPRERG
jgi:hypothetical protein